MPPEPTNQQAERVSFLVGQIMRRLFSGAKERYAHKPDMTTGQLKLLRILGQHDNSPMKELARMADITMPTATGLVGRLVENGFAVRADDPNDRRVVRVKLTRKAKNRRRKWRQMRNERIDAVLDQLPRSDRKRLLESLETVHEILDGWEQHNRDSKPK